MDHDRDRIGAVPPRSDEERRRAADNVSGGPKRRGLWPILLAVIGIIVLLVLITRGCAERDADEGVPMTTAATPAAAVPAAQAVVSPYESGNLATVLGDTTPLPATYELGQVTFASGSAELSDPAQAEIADVGAALGERPAARITLRGYADPEGDATANRVLSQGRAEAVRAAMVEAGAEQEQIEIAALGETGEAALRQNRRVEMTVTAR